MFRKVFHGGGQVQLGVLVVLVLLSLVVISILPAINSGTLGGAIATLEGAGYEVLSASEYSTLNAKMDALKVSTDAAAAAAVLANNNAVAAASAATAAANLVALHNENVEFLYPNTTDVIVLLTAPAVANTWSVWGNITGNDTTALSGCFATDSGYLSEITLHSYNFADSRLIVEIATDGAGVNVVGRVFMFTDFTYMIQFHSEPIPAGSELYYRIMCSHVNETVQARFKYYYD